MRKQMKSNFPNSPYELTWQIRLIMNGESWRKPFTSKRELSEWCKDNQSHYKRTIPEVNNHFAKLYNLR